MKWVGEARVEAKKAVRRHLQGLQAKGVVGTMHQNGGRAAERRQVQIDVGDGTKKQLMYWLWGMILKFFLESRL